MSAPGLDRLPAGGRERLFVGVPLPGALLGHVQKAQREIPAVGGLRLLRPEQLHVTIAFIGPVDSGAGQAARDVVESVPGSVGGTATLADYLLLPSAGRARVVALAVDDADGVFAGVFGHVMGGLEAAGVMQREKRPYRPHLTIARLRTPSRLRPTTECGPVPYPVESVCLYRSDLRPSGAEYRVLVRTDLETRKAGSA